MLPILNQWRGARAQQHWDMVTFNVPHAHKTFFSTTKGGEHGVENTL